MKYAKAALAIIVSALGAIVVALGTVSTGDVGDISAQNWLIALLAVLASGGLVWLAENGPAAPAVKTVLAFLTAGIGSLVLALDDNVVSQAEALTAVSAAIIATGLVYQATNKEA